MHTGHRSWKQVLWRGILSGSAASVVSTAIIAARSQAETGSPLSGTNSTSHWLWGEKAGDQRDLNLRYTGLGYLTHHLSSIFWGVVFERWFPNRHRRPQALESSRNALAVTTLAGATDYLAMPRRLTPGFERHLSGKSMFLVFAGFACALAGSRYLLQSPPPSTASRPAHSRGRRMRRHRHAGGAAHAYIQPSVGHAPATREEFAVREASGPVPPDSF